MSTFIACPNEGFDLSRSHPSLMKNYSCILLIVQVHGGALRRGACFRAASKYLPDQLVKLCG
jgi:hypothetical protein